MQSRRRLLGALGAGLASGLAGCAGRVLDDEVLTPAGEGSLSLSSSAFGPGTAIPDGFTCAGAGRSPPLSVSGVPEAAETLALVVDDPDAPGDHPFVHWLCWNLPADVGAIPAGVPRGERVPSLGDAAQGTNSAGTVGYAAPCPPEGDPPHTYRFMLYALDTALSIDPGTKRGPVDEAIEPTRIEGTTLTGTVSRP